MEPITEHPSQDPITGCLWKIFWFFVLIAVFIIFGLGVVAGMVIAGGF